jgi:WD40 repeat protein
MSWLWKKASGSAEKSARTDRHGDPLPAGTTVRLGTTRLQHVDQGNEGLGALAFSPDAPLLAGAGRDGRISLWETSSGCCLRVLERHEAEVNCLAFSPDGRRLVSGSRDGQALLWDVASGKLIYQVEADRVAVVAIAFAPRGDAWAAAGYGGVLRLFDARRPDLLQELQADADDDAERGERIVALAFSPDGTRLAGASAYTFRAEELAQDKVNDFNPLSDLPFSDCSDVMNYIMSDPQAFAEKMQEKAQDMMKAIKEEYGDAPPGHGFTFDEEGGIARGWRVGEAGRLTVWRLPGGTPEVRWDMEEGAPYLLAFSADGTALASVGRGVQAWDLAGKRRLPSGRFPARWQPGPGFSAQGRTILVPEQGRPSAQVWDAALGRELVTLAPERSWGPFALSAQGDRLAVAFGSGAVEILDCATGRDLLPLPRHPAWINGVALAATSPVTAVVSSGVHLWDRATGAELGRLAEHCRLPALSSDGTCLAGVVISSSGEAMVVVWDWRDGRHLVELESLEPASLLFAADGTLLVGNALGQVGRYDLAARRWVKVLRGAEATIEALAVTPSGEFVAGASEGMVRLWRLGSGELLRELAVPAPAADSPGRRPARIALSADGTQLAWGATTGLFLLWDGRAAKPGGSIQLPGPVEVCAVAFDPRGRCLAAATTAVTDDAHEFRLRLWDLRAGKSLLATQAQPQPLTELAFSADASQLAAAGADRTVLFWDMKPYR